MTLDTHDRATDRAAEAMVKIEKLTDKTIDIVVMIQGDEPMLVPQMIDEAIAPLLLDSSILVANLMVPLKSRKDQVDPNAVKVVVDLKNFALYFSLFLQICFHFFSFFCWFSVLSIPSRFSVLS